MSHSSAEVFSGTVNILLGQTNFLQEWGDYLGKKQIDQLSYFVKTGGGPSGNLWIIGAIADPSGLLWLFDSLDCSGQVVKQIGWVWIDKNRSQQERRQVRVQIIEILMTQGDDVLLQAGVHLFNNRSSQYFEKMGFRLKCAHIYTK